ncbi:MAG TPA: ethylbenzene dehydrogenase-related protein [Vicinamibacteria bacterium]|nr:ethylbenzene dehydrogenase-related protein [Vicinamibacteria bacterium]
MRPRPLRSIAAVTSCLLLVAACHGRTSQTSGAIDLSIEPSSVLEVSADLIELGRLTYQKECASCHGLAGDGEGDAAYLLYPRPRDFTRGEYRLVSTWDRVPTDEDLFRTISRGMPGSAMPSWAHLDERARWGLVHYIKTFSTQSMEIREAYVPTQPFEEGRGFLEIPSEPAYDTPAANRARELYQQNCAACHGVTGRGDGQQEQVDSKGRPTRPRDLTAGIFKGTPDREHVYRRIVAGLPGSPMPMSPYIYGEDAWHLTHFVLSLSSPEQRAKMEMKKFRIVASRVESLPEHPDDGIWRQTDAVNLHLMPLWWRDDRPEEVTVRALHDGEELALLMVWPDGTYDHTAIRPQDFRDAAAVQFSVSADPPFFAMGQPGVAVNIWMWKSERQADMEPAFQELDKIYPNIGIDSYPNFRRSPLEQPTRNALTLDSDPTYVTAWGVGNIVSNPLPQSPAEDLRAEGFSTLRARPNIDQAVRASGVYSTGSYRVLFRRSLRAEGADGASLRPGGTASVAFAVWNGSAGDRDGKKSVTIWQELVLAP